MEEKKTLLEIKDLTVVYQTDEATVHAVNGINFSLNERETIGLVGETGAGKTTTALTILRLLPERTGRVLGGEVLFRGENLLEKTIPEMRRVRGEEISIIFQDPMTALNPALTVGDQVLESLEIHNTAGKTKTQLDARVDELFNLVGIPAERKKEYPHQFSGGMKQRIVIAIALACAPQLLIADEPTTALDVTIQAQVLKLMENLKEELGTSMIIITHDLGVVAETCDKVAVMYAGEIVEAGSTEDIFNGTLHHPYTVGLFNAIPNLDEKTDRLHPIDGLMPDPTNLPEGCKFGPRCPHCTEACREGQPYVYERTVTGFSVTCLRKEVDADDEKSGRDRRPQKIFYSGRRP